MTYDHELILLSQTTTYDEVRNPIQTPARISILCGLNSVGRTEFYNAAAAGLKPAKVFTVHKYEYGNENEVEFEGEKYKVVRTYAINFEEIELTCERVIGNG